MQDEADMSTCMSLKLDQKRVRQYEVLCCRAGH
jgi:hypothetical protein